MPSQRDHGGGLDAAVAAFGGQRETWLDLSTGINPVPYPLAAIPADAWTALPDQNMERALIKAAREFWLVPDGAAILAAPGASALIAQIPRLSACGTVNIPAPTYNEHAASFTQHGWTLQRDGHCDAQVIVHPNNPDGHMWAEQDLSAPLRIIDESFCDISPKNSLIAQAAKPGTLILKSFGKFWGLAGLRLGFAIGDPKLIAALKDMLGPWPVSGIALDIGARALADHSWADATRTRLTNDAVRMDALMTANGALLLGGTTLFRLYQVDDAQAWQERFAHHHIWTRIFPYATDWIRLGLPPADGWARLEDVF